MRTERLYVASALAVASERVLGTRFPSRAHSVNNTRRLYESQGGVAEAERL